MQLFINITGLLLCYENLSLFTYNFSLFLDFFCSHFSRKDNDIFFVFFFFRSTTVTWDQNGDRKKITWFRLHFFHFHVIFWIVRNISVHVEQKKPCQHFYSVSKKGLDSQGTYVSSQNYNCSWIMQFSYLLPTFPLPQFLFIRFMIWFLLHNGLQLSHIGLRHVSRTCHITWFAL